MHANIYLILPGWTTLTGLCFLPHFRFHFNYLCKSMGYFVFSFVGPCLNFYPSTCLVSQLYKSGSALVKESSFYRSGTSVFSTGTDYLSHLHTLWREHFLSCWPDSDQKIVAPLLSKIIWKLKHVMKNTKHIQICFINFAQATSAVLHMAAALKTPCDGGPIFDLVIVSFMDDTHHDWNKTTSCPRISAFLLKCTIYV